MSEPVNFEQSLKQLEDAVARLERGQLPLDEALACFEAGVGSAARCRELLGEVESRVELLLKDADGTLHCEPLAGDDQDAER